MPASPRRRPLRAAVPLAVALVLAAGGVATASTRPGRDAAPADDPSTQSAPTIAPDRVTLPSHSSGTLAVLGNDTDPDGDTLVTCRYVAATRGQPSVSPDRDDPTLLDVDTSEVDPGTYTVTYHACDETAVSPGEVTVHVTRALDVVGSVVRGRTGLVRFRNPAGYRVRVDLFGPLHPHGQLGSVIEQTVAAHGARTIHVPWTSLRYLVSGGPGHDPGGVLRGIPQPHRAAARTAYDDGRRPRPATDPTDRAGSTGSTDSTDSPDQAPVTADDTASFAADGDGNQVDVLANDSDTDGPRTDGGLQVCRVEVPAGAPFTAVLDTYVDHYPADTESTIEIDPTGGRPGTYAVTYWACDDRLLTAGTLTVTITHPQDPQVVALPHHVFRFHNPGTRHYHVVYGDAHGYRRTGSIPLGPGVTRSVRVPVRRMFFFAFYGSDGSVGGVRRSRP